MNIKLSTNQIRGLLIYPLGDVTAQLILGGFSLPRTLMLALAGCFIYSWEINKWFTYINANYKNPFVKTISALVYFNPLWIARHYLFIEIAIHPHLFLTFTDLWQTILNLVVIGTKSFAGSIIFLSFAANYLIQNKIPLKNRFLSSAIFSALMAVYYALSKAWL